jgi:lipoteichoic acid synthase
MLALVRRLATLTVPRAAVHRTLAVSSPLIAGLIVTKLLKLAVADQNGSVPDNLFETCLEFVARTVHDSTLTFLLLAPLLIAAAVTLLARHSGRRACWIAGVPVAYLIGIFALTLAAEPNPRHPLLFARAGAELRQLGNLWWREALIAEAVIGALSLHFASADRKPASVQRLLIWALMTGAYGMLALDLGYVLVTHSALTAEDLLFAVDSPGSTLLLIRESMSVPMELLSPLLMVSALAIVYLLGRARPELDGIGRRGLTVRLGMLLWPAVCVAFAARAAAPPSAFNSVAGTALMTVPMETLYEPLKRALLLRRAASPSAQVPALLRAPITVATTPRTQRLNVVVVMLESTRADATSVYTPGLDTTPYLAELARESLVVDQMYTVAPRSSAARLATLAGQYSATMDLEPSLGTAPRQRRPLTSLPHLLRTQGYTSAFFTPATLNFENDRQVIEALDFDQISGLENLPPPANGYRMIFGVEDRQVLPAIEHWLDARTSDKRPFLLTVVTNVGHWPFELPPDFERHAYPHRNARHLQYLNCVHYLDGYVHDLVAALRERSLLENTVVIVLGDHGEEFYEHGTYVRGQTLYDEVLQVPMLIRLPRAAQRVGHITGLRQQIDVLPTVIEALGLELHDNVLPGRSLLGATGHQTLFFSEYVPTSLMAMRTGSRKYIYSFPDDATSVFDLDRDPDERVDIRAQVPAEVVSQAETDLHTWEIRVRHTF